MKINQDMTIEEILEENKNAGNILLESGMHCIGCPSSLSETLEEACQVHQLDLHKILDELNKNQA
jgi:hybrid cluster-associated redox disulfide protein